MPPDVRLGKLLDAEAEDYGGQQEHAHDREGKQAAGHPTEAARRFARWSQRGSGVHGVHLLGVVERNPDPTKDTSRNGRSQAGFVQLGHLRNST